MRLSHCTIWILARGGCEAAAQALKQWRALDAYTEYPMMPMARCTPDGYKVELVWDSRQPVTIKVML